MSLQNTDAYIFYATLFSFCTTFHFPYKNVITNFILCMHISSVSVRNPTPPPFSKYAFSHPASLAILFFRPFSSNFAEEDEVRRREQKA